MDLLGLGLLNFGADLLGIGAASANQDKQNEFNAIEAQKTRDWQEKMWNANNEYNTPLAQTNRLREAGLNPNLVYGNGSMQNTASMATSGAQASSAPFQSDMAQRVSQAFDFAQKKLTLKNMDLQNQELEEKIANLAQDTSVKQKSAEEIQSRVSLNNLARLLQSKTFQNDVEASYWNVRKLANENDVLRQSANKLGAEYDVLQKQLKVMDSQIFLNDAQRQKTMQDIDNSIKALDKQIQVWNSDIRKNDSLARQAYANAEYQQSLKKQVEVMIPIMKRQGIANAKIAECEAYIAEVTKNGKVNNLDSIFKCQDIMVDILKAQLKSAQTSNNWQEMQIASQILSNVLGGIGKVKGTSVNPYYYQPTHVDETKNTIVNNY